MQKAMDVCCSHPDYNGIKIDDTGPAAGSGEMSLASLHQIFQEYYNKQMSIPEAIAMMLKESSSSTVDQAVVHEMIQVCLMSMSTCTSILITN